MSKIDEVRKAMVTAMKAGDKERKESLSMLLSALKNKAIDKGVEALLRNGIVQTYNKWSERGYCPIYARENATRMYEPYHILGGNDVATDLIEDLKGLPTEPQKKKEGVEDDT